LYEKNFTVGPIMKRMRLLAIVLRNSDWTRSFNTKETLVLLINNILYILLMKFVTHTLVYQHSEFQRISMWELELPRNTRDLLSSYAYCYLLPFPGEPITFY